MKSADGIDWNEVIEDLGPALLRYFLAAGFARASASDGVQETLLRLVRLAKEGEYDPNRGSPRMLAFGIARLVKHEFYRKVGEHDLYGDPKEFAERKGSVSAFDLGNEKASTDTLYAERESARNLRAVIATLEYPVREIFFLLIDEELKLEEIAGILSIPVGTVKSHVHRGKEKIKLSLKERV